MTKSAPRTGHRLAVAAAFLGWTLDAFDFFVVVFLVDALATNFHVAKSAIVWTLTATLAMRPVGALLFGMLADRYGRRVPLMAAVIYFSTLEVACGFAPSYTVFLILRTLFGIGMGGEWGVGASLALEQAPGRLRGLLSGVLQSGYSVGYLLAAIAARFLLPVWGWRSMFFAGLVPAVITLAVLIKTPESEAWKQHRPSSMGAILRTVGQFWKQFVYLAFLMTLMMFLSHGTQDLYPDFLMTQHKIAPATVSYIAMLYNVGAIAGGIFFGHLSQGIGRRRSMLVALVVSLLVIPFWSFGGSVAVLAIGAFLMQVGVQGAWGVIPAHLNEIAPDSARGLIPGLAYQIGIIIAAPTNNIEYKLRDAFGYQWALAGFEIATIVLLAVALMMGHEKKGKSFLREEVAATAP